ncbi:MAG: hypothetical protein WC141_07610 [Arcobacteraceae bacterium]
MVEVLTKSDRPRKYWSDLKAKLQKEGSELSEKIGQLKMKAPDGKMRLTDVATTEQLFKVAMFKVTKEALELKTGKKIVTSQNAKKILENQKKIK